jgi:hypothetical protein
MLKIDRKNQSFTRLEMPKLAEISILERYGLQQYICNSPEEFFGEIGQELFLIGKEVKPSDDVDDRIDILGLDKEGHAVVIELKRGDHKFQLLQAISYAGMVSKWEPNRFMRDLNKQDRDKLERFLDEEDTEKVNREQRIILVAEAFDYSVLVAADWLTEEFGVDIRCCRIALATDSTSGAEYLVCSTVFPEPKLAEKTIRRGRIASGLAKLDWPDWPNALGAIQNKAIQGFFTEEVNAGQEKRLIPRGRFLVYRDSKGKDRWWVRAHDGPHGNYAHVAQYGRFEGDEDYWRRGLKEVSVVNPLRMKFYLETEAEVQYFRQTVREKANVAWIEVSDETEDGEVTES